MAKNQVTLTFAGEDKGLKQQIAKVGDDARGLEADLDKAAKGVERFDKSTRRSTEQSERFGKGFDNAGEKADLFDTRMMGTADGITGVSDLMRDGELTSAEYAMAFSDIGSSLYNTVIPSLKDTVTSLKSVNLTTIGMAAGLGAGAAALLYFGWQASKTKVDADELEASIKSLDEVAFRKDVQEAQRYDLLGEAFAGVLETSPELAQSFYDQAEAAGASEAELAEMRDMMGEVDEANESAAESIRGVTDALRAQFDPLFGAVDAARSLRDSQEGVAEATAAVTAAEAEYGVGSAEAAQATRDLESANYDAVAAASGFDAAQRELAAAVADGDVSIDSARNTLQSWVGQGLITREQAALMALAFNHVKGRADDMAGRYDVNVYGNDYVSSVVDRINQKMFELRDKTLTVRTHYVTTGQGGGGGIPLASGGIVPQYLAGGGIGGPRGTDTVPAWLTPGEMVLNDGQQGQLWQLLNGAHGGGGGGGGVHVTVNAQGSILSERDIVRIVRDAVVRGDLRGVAA